MEPASAAASGLDGRSLQIVKALIDEYMRDGGAVSSERVAHASGLRLSSSSVRSILARLEEQGFIRQDHVSSGRRPTAKGIRIYLSSLIQMREPSSRVADELRQSMRTEAVNVMAKSVPETLAKLTGMVALVALPRTEEAKIAQLQFVRLSATRVMAVLVTREGEVRNRLLETEGELSVHELERAAAIFNENCAGESLADAKLRLGGLLAALQGRIAGILRQMLAKLAGGEEDRKLYSAGEDSLLARAQLLEEAARLDELLRLLHHKSLLLRLLDKGRAADDVSVFIGAEAGVPEMEEFSLVTAPCAGQDGNVIGALGLIGPIRMKYAKIVPIMRMSSLLMKDAARRISSDYGKDG